MNKSILLSLLALMLSLNVFPQQQQRDLRTNETKIADLLMKLPSQSSVSHNKIMAELDALGESAVIAIAANLVAPGKGNDISSRYAISGLVKYVANGTDKNQMIKCSQAVCKAITNSKDDEVKDFLLQELRYVAGDEAVEILGNYLQSKRLCDPAARVLVSINSELSKKTLAEALLRSKESQQISLVEAIGQVRYTAIAETIRVLSTTTDLNLKKTVLRTLAELGDLPSAALLLSEAVKARYSFESTDAAGSYLLFLRRAVENGNNSFADKASLKIINNTEIPTYFRSCALQILSKSAGKKAVPVLLKTLKSDDKDYRMAAQALLGTFLSPKLSDRLQKTAKSTTNSELKSELIDLLSENNVKSALPMMVEMLQSKDRKIQLAAIKATAKTGQNEAIIPIIMAMENGDNEITSVAKTALLTITGNGVADAAASFVPHVSGFVRCTLIEIIAKRQESRYTNLIFAETGNSDALVKQAAIGALASIVKIGDTEKIGELLNNSTDESEISALQEAFFSAIKSSGNQQEQVAHILSVMKKSGEKQSRYLSILAKTGGVEALKIVEKEFESGSPEQKENAFKALSNWSDFTALEALFRICKNNISGKFHDVALNSFISGINKSANTADQKVLMFRKAMELVNSVDQKKQILQGLAKTNTLPGLIFVSQYLDNEDLRQTAVQSVCAIALANKWLYGTNVEGIIRKAISLNNDTEADYQNQAMLKHLSSLPSGDGFVPMFNGKDLNGWKGLVGNPVLRSKMSLKAMADAQVKSDKEAFENWIVENGNLIFNGNGNNLCSAKNYGDFEMYVDWKLYPGKEPDAGIYLRGTPQVQIWDTSRVNVGARVGSGGLYNNKKNTSKPLLVADNPVGEWNTFYIKMVGDNVTVLLNGQPVVDKTIMENYWDRTQSIFPDGQIELQAHGSKVAYRDIYIHELPRPKPYRVSKEEEQNDFNPIFNGVNLDGWIGTTTEYVAQEGKIVYQPSSANSSGNFYTTREYGDFILRFEFQLKHGTNNGLGIRTPIHGNAAYVGMELQILDNDADMYKDRLQPYQYHGSVYGVIPAKRGFLKPVGEWNYQEVKAVGTKITITLNGEVILDGDIAAASNNGKETADHLSHPGLLNPTGHIGFLGHGKPIEFRNLRIKNL